MIQFSAYGVIALLALAAALSTRGAVASASPAADLALVAATVEPADVRIEATPWSIAAISRANALWRRAVGLTAWSRTYRDRVRRW
jgi:hypothetical protein